MHPLLGATRANRAVTGTLVVTVAVAFVSACSDNGVQPITSDANTGVTGPTTGASAGGASSTTTTTTASTTSDASSTTAATTTASATTGSTSTGGAASASTTGTSTSDGAAGSTSNGTEGTTSSTDGMAAGGTAGASGTTTGGSVTPTSGCGMSVDLQPAQWVQQPSLTIDNTQRNWSVWLPNNYDPNRAYPLVVLLHGCGGETNNVPIQNQSGDEAILIRGAAAQSDNCWNTQESGPNDEFFDAMLDTTMAQMCIDSERVFVAGYSSGSWLINLLNCVRADRIRAVGTVAGGNPLFGMPSCNGNVAAIFIHSLYDNENDISGSESARDRLIGANGCSDTTMPTSPDPCVAYQGCQAEYPIVWCATDVTANNGHDREDQFAAPAMWDFFSQF